MRSCPRCDASPFDQFLPGQVVRSPWTSWWHAVKAALGLATPRRGIFAVICRDCKEIVDYEGEVAAAQAQARAQERFDAAVRAARPPGDGKP